MNSQKVDTLTNGIKKTEKDSIYFKGLLPILDPDSCLLLLLDAIVEADSNATYFRNGLSQVGYSIDFRDHDGYISMDVWPIHFNKSLRFDYFGAIDLGGTIFLCRGNYQSNALFAKSQERSMPIILKRPIKREPLDDFDKLIFDLIYNVSLYGTYVECTGLKIITSIYIQGKLTDYKIGQKKINKDDEDLLNNKESRCQ